MPSRIIKSVTVRLNYWIDIEISENNWVRFPYWGMFNDTYTITKPTVYKIPSGVLLFCLCIYVCTIEYRTSTGIALKTKAMMKKKK